MRQLLDFAKHDVPPADVIDLGQVLRALEPNLRTLERYREEAAVLLVQVHAGVPFGGLSSRVVNQSSRVISKWSMPHSWNTPPWRLNP